MRRALPRRLIEALELGGGLGSVVALSIVIGWTHTDDRPDARALRRLADHAATCRVCRLPEYGDGRAPSVRGPRDATPRDAPWKIAEQARVLAMTTTTPATEAGRRDPGPVAADHAPAPGSSPRRPRGPVAPLP
jgi:hypothetical protein